MRLGRRQIHIRMREREFLEVSRYATSTRMKVHNVTTNLQSQSSKREVERAGLELKSAVYRGQNEQKNNTRDSNVVPHRSTNLARQCLTSLSRREAVLSLWYGRSCRIGTVKIL